MSTDKEDHDKIIDKLDSIFEILNGNGKLGVCAKVNILWSVGLFLTITTAGLVLKAILAG